MRISYFVIQFNIKLLRLNHNDMPLKQLEELSGIRGNTLLDYQFSRAISIKVEHIDKLCEIFNCQPSELMTYVPNHISDTAE